MFLEIEGNTIINLDLIDRIEFRHAAHQQSCILWTGGIIQAESQLAYKYFKQNPNLIAKVSPEPAPAPPVTE